MVLHKVFCPFALGKHHQIKGAPARNPAHCDVGLDHTGVHGLVYVGIKDFHVGGDRVLLPAPVVQLWPEAEEADARDLVGVGPGVSYLAGENDPSRSEIKYTIQNFSGFVNSWTVNMIFVC